MIVMTATLDKECIFPPMLCMYPNLFKTANTTESQPTFLIRYTLPYIVNKDNPCLILCYVIPGNVYPVIESLNDPNTLLGNSSTVSTNFLKRQTCNERLPIPFCFDEC